MRNKYRDNFLNFLIFLTLQPLYIRKEQNQTKCIEKNNKKERIHSAFNPKINIVRINLSRKEGESELIRVEDTGLEKYVLTNEKNLLMAARRSDGDYEQHLGMIEGVKEFNKRRINQQTHAMKQRKLHSQLFNQIEEIAGGKMVMETGIQKEKRKH